jgi:dolichyl-phosphate-mannose-protein mannosyltransferase
MAVMVRAERVMYLYHYFIPLIFSYCIAALMFCYGFGERYTQRRAWVVAALLLIVLQLVAAFWFFAPLTYYEPLTAREFLQRAWFEHWRLEPVL